MTLGQKVRQAIAATKVEPAPNAETLESLKTELATVKQTVVDLETKIIRLEDAP